MTFVIVADSASDTQLKTTAREDVYIVPTMVIIDDKEYLDPELSNKELLQKFEEGKTAKTSQPSPEQYEKVYGEAATKGIPILGIHISSKLSGTYNGARLISQDIDADIKLFDTYNVSFGAGYFVKMACKLKDKGYSRDEVLDIFDRIRNKVHIEVVIDNIDHLRNGGRVNLGQYWLLKLLRLRPVVTNEDGILVRKSMTRGGNAGAKKIAKRIRKYDDYGELPTFIIGHVTSPHIMEYLQSQFERVEKEEMTKIIISSTLLSHVGRDSFGIMVAPSLKSIENMMSN